MRETTMPGSARLLHHAKAMRSSPTPGETVLWQQLRAKRLAGYKFKRQQPVCNFIVDFVCLAERLVIEVDGGQHNDSPEDAVRDAWFAGQGFRVLRFWNSEISQNLDGILQRILDTLAPSPSIPLPRGEREEKSTTRAPLAPLPSRERGWGEGEPQ